MKVAIVHYWLIGMRGGERVVEALLDLYPDADLFTHVYDPDAVSAKIRSRVVRTTFINRLPQAKKRYQSYLPLMPLALESLDLSGYDLVLSSESGPAKGVIVPPGARHLCYCHTPMRYVWDFYHRYRRQAGPLTRLLMGPLCHYLRLWDVTSAVRVDAFAANSANVARRIARFYGRSSVVIPPPVTVADFDATRPRNDRYLVVGELVAYKEPEKAVAACIALGRPLTVIGGGALLERLRSMAKGHNVEVLGRQDTAVVREHLSRCRALLFPGEEDFGLVPVEAMASGAPVIASARGGALETVVDGVTGVLYPGDTVEALMAAIRRFEAGPAMVAAALVNRAAQFDISVFRQAFAAFAAGESPPERSTPPLGGATGVAIPLMPYANVCSKSVPGRTGRLRSLLALLGLDLAVLMACLVTVVLGRYLMGGRFSPGLYLSLVWTPLLYAGIALLMRVYSHLQTPPEAIKKISGALSFFFLVTALFFFLTHEAASYSRSIFLVSWGLSLLAVPLARRIARIRYPSIFAWRAPCVVIGSAETVGPMVRRIEDNPHSGLRVIAVSVDTLDHEPFDVPVVPFADLPSLAAVNPHCYAVLLLDPCHLWPPTDAMERLSFHFRHVLLRSPQLDQISTWTRGVSISGLTLLTCHFKLLDPWRMRFKRAFDIVFCLTAGLAILPFMLLLAALIRLDSPGPAFFTQKRLGRGGRHFHIFKFRTMRSDAEAHLAKLLRDDPELARQWAENQKMADDPRITRLGRWLRTTSIDELPQLINVLLGQMSLVGPRPIVDSEVARYGRDYGTYKHVRPGITGLWQISGRNRTAYDQRVTLDVAYVRNWSIYMDLWILARTVFEVVQRSGC